MGRLVHRLTRSRVPLTEAPEPFNFARDVIEVLSAEPQRDRATVRRCRRRDRSALVQRGGGRRRPLGGPSCGRANSKPGDRVLVLLGRTPTWHSVLLVGSKAGLPSPFRAQRAPVDGRREPSGWSSPRRGCSLLDRGHAAGSWPATAHSVEVIVVEEAATEAASASSRSSRRTTRRSPMPPSSSLRPAAPEAHVSHRVTCGAILQARRGASTSAPTTSSGARPRPARRHRSGTACSFPGQPGPRSCSTARASTQRRRLGPHPPARRHGAAPGSGRVPADGGAPRRERRGLDRVRRAVAVGGPLDPGVAEAFRSMSGLTVLEETEDKVFERSGSLEAPTVAANGLVDTLNDRVSPLRRRRRLQPRTGRRSATGVMPPGAAVSARSARRGRGGERRGGGARRGCSG